MSEIRVDTKIVESVSTVIADNNKKIDREFETLKNKMNHLQNHWSGAAFSQAIYKFNTIKSTYYENVDTRRYNVVDNYVRFLRESVGLGYEQTENVNHQLSDAFK